MDHELLTVHMVQHLLVMTVAAPLILLGAPVITLLNGLPRHLVNRVLMPVLRCSSVQKLESTAAHPVFCWLASTAVVIAWHIPALFELGLRSEWWHRGEQLSFFAAGLLFWWPVVQPWPSAASWPQWTVPLYLFLATLPCDALSGFLTFCDRVVYANYLTSHRVFSISPLGDQEFAGALMWVWVTFAYLAPAAAVTIWILSPPPKTRIPAELNTYSGTMLNAFRDNFERPLARTNAGTGLCEKLFGFSREALARHANPGPGAQQT
jgi:cytochrome c oxidase assembly factor CtaG